MRRRVFVCCCLLLWGLPGGSSAAEELELPTQDVVVLVDNSSSMAQSDPLQMRGVAASLFLDMAEISSRLRAGLVFFGERPRGSDVQDLQPPGEIRVRLQADRLPPADQGATHIQSALEAGLDLLRGSTADIRRILLVTDGVPADLRDPGSEARQREVILGTLVPRAAAEGVEIFALGLSSAVDEPFLNAITAPTGGIARVSQDHGRLLEEARRLLRDRDNVFTVVREELAGGVMEHSFQLPVGVDRARLTLILLEPNLFLQDQIEFSLAPESGGDGGRAYRVTRDDAAATYVAAWTSFLSSPGDYTLRVRSTKPGYEGEHLGIQVFVEALSILDVDLTLAPEVPAYVFGDEVRARVRVASGGGTLDASSYRAAGRVESGPGAEPLVFHDGSARFEVPDVAGTHRVVVRVETSELLGEATAEVEYRAVPPERVILESNPQELRFPHPLGAEKDEAEALLKLHYTVPEGGRDPRVALRFLLSPPAGLNEKDLARLIDGEGRSLVIDGTREYALPPEGLDLRLRFAMDPAKPFSVDDGRYQGELRIDSDQAAGELRVPFEIVLKRPSLEVRGAPSAFALWWDPDAPRRVPLGEVVSDAAVDTSLYVAVAGSANAEDSGVVLANLELLAGEEGGEGENESGLHFHEGVVLESGEPLPLALKVTPAPGTDPLGRAPVEVSVRSQFGVETKARPVLWTVGPPWSELPVLGPISLHGRHLATWLLILVGGGLLLSRMVRDGRELARFWSFRAGRTVPLGNGPLVVGAGGSGGGAPALALPNAGGDLDDVVLGRVRVAGRAGQTLRDPSGERLRVAGMPVTEEHDLHPGDGILVEAADPDDEPPWELEYLDFDPEAAEGEAEVVASPAPGIWRSLLLRPLLRLLVLAGLIWWLGTDSAAALAYHLPLADRIYSEWLLPLVAG